MFLASIEVRVDFCQHKRWPNIASTSQSKRIFIILFYGLAVLTDSRTPRDTQYSVYLWQGGHFTIWYQKVKPKQNHNQSLVRREVTLYFQICPLICFSDGTHWEPEGEIALLSDFVFLQWLTEEILSWYLSWELLLWKMGIPLQHENFSLPFKVTSATALPR